MDFIPGIDGPSEGVPRVLACFSNVCTTIVKINCTIFAIKNSDLINYVEPFTR